jgi:glycosyltransferase involved in cell wall biosynthesis
MHEERMRQEIELADLILAPSKFVADSVRRFVDKPIALSPYGVDLTDWTTKQERSYRDEIRFLFVGQCSVLKGIPLLLDAWKAANLEDATLQLVGSWHLAESKKKNLPPHCTWVGPVARNELVHYYRRADVFVLPTNFEGRALVIGEALAVGLPIVTTDASGWVDVIDASCGRIVPPNNFDALVECLRHIAEHRDQLPAMSRAARAKAEACSWETYRHGVSRAVAPFV